MQWLRGCYIEMVTGQPCGSWKRQMVEDFRCPGPKDRDLDIVWTRPLLFIHWDSLKPPSSWIQMLRFPPWGVSAPPVLQERWKHKVSPPWRSHVILWSCHSCCAHLLADLAASKFPFCLLSLSHHHPPATSTQKNIIQCAVKCVRDERRHTGSLFLTSSCPLCTLAGYVFETEKLLVCLLL